MAYAPLRAGAGPVALDVATVGERELFWVTTVGDMIVVEGATATPAGLTAPFLFVTRASAVKLVTAHDTRVTLHGCRQRFTTDAGRGDASRLMGALLDAVSLASAAPPARLNVGLPHANARRTTTTGDVVCLRGCFLAVDEGLADTTGRASGVAVRLADVVAVHTWGGGRKVGVGGAFAQDGASVQISTGSFREAKAVVAWLCRALTGATCSLFDGAGAGAAPAAGPAAGAGGEDPDA
jgi:hypothetical protein